MKMAGGLAVGSCVMNKAESMKGTGLMIREKAKAMRSTTIPIFMWATSHGIKLMVKGSTHGPVVSTMKETGTTGRNMGTENGKGMEERRMRETG